MQKDLNELIKNLREVKNRGWIQSMRKGPTGVGYTLESCLNIQENNFSVPDVGDIELKARRKNSTSMITLFTFNKRVWKMDPLRAIQRYGVQDKDKAKDRLGMYYTMSVKPNNAGLFLHIDKEIIAVKSIGGDVIAEWHLNEIVKKFLEKVKNVLLVTAQVEIRDGVEYFLYDDAVLLSGGTDLNLLRQQFQNEHLMLDLRLHEKSTHARNHGTAFRVKLQYLEKLYQETQIINL